MAAPTRIPGVGATNLTPDDKRSHEILFHQSPTGVARTDTSSSSSSNAPPFGWSGGDRSLTPIQQKALSIIKQAGEDVALVVTNALVSSNPIVFVNAQWQLLSGLTSEQAVGNPASLMQGRETSGQATAAITLALKQRRSCKALVINYRAADAARPFWCMLSISPIVHGGELVLWVASLRDYSEHAAKLLQPPQLC